MSEETMERVVVVVREGNTVVMRCSRVEVTVAETWIASKSVTSVPAVGISLGTGGDEEDGGEDGDLEYSCVVWCEGNLVVIVINYQSPGQLIFRSHQKYQIIRSGRGGKYFQLK